MMNGIIIRVSIPTTHPKHAKKFFLLNLSTYKGKLITELKIINSSINVL